MYIAKAIGALCATACLCLLLVFKAWAEISTSSRSLTTRGSTVCASFLAICLAACMKKLLTCAYPASLSNQLSNQFSSLLSKACKG